MKIYTQTIDIALQSPKRFWVAPNSDFKIGVKIVKRGTPVANEFTVKQGATTLIADEDKVDGFTTYTIKSGSTGSVEYAVEVAGVAEKQKITQIVTDSTVFEVGGSGGGDVPSDVATKTWVQDYVSVETSAFVDDTELGAVLEAYPTTSTMNSAIESATSTFVSASDVDAAISTATSTFVSATDVESAISTATSTFVNASQVEEIVSAATSEFQTATQVSDAITAATSTFVSATDVEAAISTATSNFVSATDVSAAISTATSDFQTATQVSQAISAATSTLVSTTAMNSAISAATSNFVSATDVSAAVSAGVSNKVTNLGDVAGIMKITQSAYDALVSASTVNPSTLYIVVD